MIAMRVDQVIIGQMLNDKEVGLYSAAVKLSELWYFIPIAIAASTYPALVEAKHRSEELYYGRLQKLYNFLVTLAIAVAIVMTFLSGPVVRLLYGPAYAASGGALRILIWSGLPVCFGCAWSNWMILENRMKTLFVFQAIGAVVNLMLNFLLIPRLGITGSALAHLNLLLGMDHNPFRYCEVPAQDASDVRKSSHLVYGASSDKTDRERFVELEVLRSNDSRPFLRPSARSCKRRCIYVCTRF